MALATLGCSAALEGPSEEASGGLAKGDTAAGLQWYAPGDPHVPEGPMAELVLMTVPEAQINPDIELVTPSELIASAYAMQYPASASGAAQFAAVPALGALLPWVLRGAWGMLRGMLTPKAIAEEVAYGVAVAVVLDVAERWIVCQQGGPCASVESGELDADLVLRARDGWPLEPPFHPTAALKYSTALSVPPSYRALFLASGPTLADGADCEKVGLGGRGYAKCYLLWACAPLNFGPVLALGKEVEVPAEEKTAVLVLPVDNWPGDLRVSTLVVEAQGPLRKPQGNFPPVQVGQPPNLTTFDYTPDAIVLPGEYGLFELDGGSTEQGSLRLRPAEGMDFAPVTEVPVVSSGN